MTEAILKITDGITTINLLSSTNGFHLKEWLPMIPAPKDGGVFAGSSLMDGRRLVQRVNENVIETMNMSLSADTQDQAIRYMQDIRRLLIKAHQYWTTEWQSEPVWIIARSPCETNIRYATIIDWRLQSDGNPYTAPFFGDIGQLAVMENLELVLERDHWTDYPAGSSTCIEISAMQPGGDDIATIGPGYSPAASSDDGSCHHDVEYIYLTQSYITFGTDENDYRRDGLFLFNNVPIPIGATIIDARITGIAGTAQAPYGVKGHTIMGDSDPTPAPFSTYADYMARTPTDQRESWLTPESWVPGSQYTTCDISSVVQAIVSASGWASGNDMAIFICGDAGGDRYPCYRSFKSYDGGDPVVLRVEYIVDPIDIDFGQPETCVANEVHVVNKCNKSSLVDICTYDGSNYVTILGDTLPYDLFDTGGSPSTYDLLIGAASPFNNVIFNIGTPASGATVTFYYSTGSSSWSAFSAGELQDNTDDFTITGVNGIHFPQPLLWDTDTYNGNNLYWIKINFSALSTSPTQQTIQPYTVLNPYFEVADDVIAGDLPALMQLTARNRGHDSYAGNFGSIGGIHIGVRSLERGMHFSAYFNASDEQHQLGVDCSVTSPASFYDDVAVPTGRHAIFSGTISSFAERVRWTITSIYSAQYCGRYRAFLRYTQSGGIDREYYVRLGYGINDNDLRYTDTFSLIKQSATTVVAILELGQVVVPNIQMEDMSDFYLCLEFLDEETSTGALAIYDLILLPYDEWAGSFESSVIDSGNLLLDHALRIDPTSRPKDKGRAVIIDVADNDKLLGYWRAVENDYPSIIPNTNVRVWFVMDEGLATEGCYTTSFMSSLSVSARKLQRYLSMRGSR